MKYKTDSEERNGTISTENKEDNITLSKEEYEKKYYTIPMFNFDNFDIVEPELVPITPKYSQYEAFDSLRLPINFSKMPSMDSAVLAYNIFLQKGRDRSKYLVNVVAYCDSHKTNTNPEMRRSISYLRYLKMIKRNYKIETKRDIRELLATDKNSPEYQKIEEKALKMQCSACISIIIKAELCLINFLTVLQRIELLLFQDISSNIFTMVMIIRFKFN